MNAHVSTDAPVRTTCPYCGTGCGVLGSGAQVTAGDPDHPTNAGRLCGKGSALGETLSLDTRLLHPMVEGRRADWDSALDLVARRFSEAVRQHGPDSVAFYVSGQLLTEDYYVANKLMKGFLGSGNIDTNSRLCMASSVAGHRRAFGEDVVPGCYEDLDEADLVVLTGSNAAWCHPILFRRVLDARTRRGTRVVTIDPRRTASAKDSDLHLAVRPGTDVLLFNGLLAHLERCGRVDRAYVAEHTTGFPDALSAAKVDAGDAELVAAACGLDATQLLAFYDMFAATERVVTVYSQGINQSSHGTDKVNAIINCHLATGRIGREGMGPFSVTGQPNAMGGREVGGLANQLAGHMDFSPESVERVGRFWQAPGIATRPGLKAVDLFERLASGGIKALWVMGTNPAASLPDGERVRRALKACDFLAVSDVVPDTDTARSAHVLLPAAAWGEKDGTVTNSERRISRQRAFMPLPAEARPDWWIVSQVARRMGFGVKFPYAKPAEIFREHAALTAFENEGRRVLDLGGLASLSDADYDRLAPVQWPVPAGGKPQARLFGDGRFPTPDGRARFVAVTQEAPANTPDAARPLVLNTGRLRDQWHTMTRTGEVARLMAHQPEPVLEIAPADATVRGLADNSLAEVTSAWGRAVARVRVSADQQAGQIFLPMHWTDSFTARGSAGRLANPACDALSGQPELKHTPAQVHAFPMRWEALVLSRRRYRPTGLGYWTRTTIAGGYAYRLAGGEPADEGTLLAREHLARGREAVEFLDRRRGIFRAMSFDGQGRLLGCLLVAPAGALPDASWLIEVFSADEPLAPESRRALLGARPAQSGPPEGRIVCSCFAVGVERIRRTIRDHQIVDAAALGSLLKCGTNCGSCLAELREIVARERQNAPA